MQAVKSSRTQRWGGRADEDTRLFLMLSLSFLQAETARSGLLITNGLTASHQNLHFCTNSSMTARCRNSVPTDEPDFITYSCINICQRETHRNKTVSSPSRCPQPSVTHPCEQNAREAITSICFLLSSLCTAQTAKLCIEPTPYLVLLSRVSIPERWLR